jgi:hypothetical protein
MYVTVAFLVLAHLPRPQRMENVKVSWHIISTTDFTVQLPLVGLMFSGLEDSKETFGQEM